ncbi:hypothetical protein PFLG_02505 [Plasmodium falciparum RAJ116]|uniref:Uncharacterized protein n=1 Tax=Plasmodium falciparum RAJ116 TaxID=580058 RepID=A0A0L0CYI8_PLAFA|nr:hypothetical protein PFLG_02505 [Plasmodium falciparum RAJ116]
MKGYFNIYFLIPLIFLYNVIRINESIIGRTLYNRQDESSDISRVNSPELNNNHKTNIYDSDYEDVNNKLINSFVENKSVKKKRSLSFINNKTKSYDIIPPSYSYRNDKFNSLSENEDNSGNTNSNNFANTSEISIGKDNKQYTFIQKRTHLFACGIKRKSIKWICRENSEKITVCVPDRKIQLCIANFLNSRLETMEKFKEIFLISVNTEAKLLYNKNEGKDPSIFCNELRNSFSDFRSSFIGDDMDFGGNTDRVKGYINTKFSDYYKEKNVEKLNNIKKEWWEKNKANLWNHMIVNHKGNISKECAIIPAEEPQINLWIKEWNENFLMEKKRLFLNIKDKCVENKKYEACFGGCRLPCSSYTSFMKKSKTQMEVLTNLYKKKNSGVDKNNFLNDLFKKNNKNDLDDFFKNEKEYDDLCDCRYTATIIKSFLNGPAKNDVDIASQINVNDLRGFGCNYKSNNEKSWNCTGTFTNKFPGTCEPPRRQTLCLGRTYLLHRGHEEDYKEHLLGASIYEAQLLKYKYKEKDENALCSIIQNSYADLADIIKGSDIIKDYYDDKINEIEGFDSSRDSENGRGDTTSNTHDVRRTNIVSERRVNSHDFIRNGMANNNAHHQYITQIKNNGIIRGQEESAGNSVNYKDNPKRSNFSSENDHKKNIQEYNSRDTKRVREEIIKLSKQNKCNNEYSMEYCTYSDERNSSPGPCSREERKKLCCQISDYCLKYFNFYSIEYYNCIKSEIKSPEYKCFKSEGQSSIPYFAAGGILVVIVLLLSSASRMGKSNEEYDIGESNIEATFEENNYLNKLSRICKINIKSENFILNK